MKVEKTNVMRILDQKKVTYNSYSYANTDAISGIEVATVLNQNIVKEKETLLSYVNYIEKVLKNKVLFKHFDADGIWQEELLEIPFSQITTVKFNTRLTLNPSARKARTNRSQ